MSRVLTVLVITLTSALFGCGRPKAVVPAPSPAAKAVTAEFHLTSPAFRDGESIPVQYTADGQGLSPQLDWAGAPAGTKEMALIMDDPDAPSGTFTHWVIYATPLKATSLSEGVPNAETVPPTGGLKQGSNSAGTIGYFPPSPPPGKVHHYVFRLYALDAPVNLPPNARADELRKAMSGHTLATAELTGTYQRTR